MEEIDLEAHQCTVSFYKSKAGSYFFTKSDVRFKVIDDDQIVMILPPPSKCGGAQRLAEQMTFGVDLSKYM